jgi:hypothetical protein
LSNPTTANRRRPASPAPAAQPEAKRPRASPTTTVELSLDLTSPPRTHYPRKATVKQREVAVEIQHQRTTEGLDVGRLKNMATVEFADLTSRVNRPVARTECRKVDDRWKLEWNGRRNYKKFIKCPIKGPNMGPNTAFPPVHIPLQVRSGERRPGPSGG